MLNLITGAWIPVITRSGARRSIRPAEVVDPELVALDFPRPDFNGAVTELLIGLLATAAAPADEPSWRERWVQRPSTAELDALLAPFASAFDISSFMQNASVADQQAEPVDRLLLDAAGDQAAKEGRDYLNRGSIEALSPAMAVAALFTLQSYATLGGAGYAVSVRGGGPLTTLVVSGDDLWGRLWPNVETREQIVARSASSSDGQSAIFPWLRGDDGAALTPGSANPLMVYWATPRRIQLIFSPADGAACSLSGELPGTLVREIRRAPRGQKYDGWSHPLTPQYLSKASWLPVLARPEPIGYRQWLGLVQETPKGDRRPALSVSTVWLHRGQLRDARLVAHGYATHQSTVHRWTTSEMPLVLADPETREERERLARLLVTAAAQISDKLRAAVSNARGPFWLAISQFWRDTEPTFLWAMRNALDLEADDPSLDLRVAWFTAVRRQTYKIFDTYSANASDLREVVAARHRLTQALHNALLAKALELPVDRGRPPLLEATAGSQS